MRKQEETIPIPSYCLAFMLGDGTFGPQARLYVNTEQLDVLKPFEKMVDEHGLGMTYNRSGSDGCIHVNLTDKGRRWSRLLNELRRLELFTAHGASKFVPLEYLMLPVRELRKLLAGLLDSDGSWNKSTRHYDFCNTSLYLVEAVHSLAARCGLEPTCVVSKKVYNKDKPCWRVRFRDPDAIIPCLVKGPRHENPELPDDDR